MFRFQTRDPGPALPRVLAADRARVSVGAVVISSSMQLRVLGSLRLCCYVIGASRARCRVSL